MKMMTVLFW